MVVCCVAQFYWTEVTVLPCEALNLQPVYAETRDLKNAAIWKVCFSRAACRREPPARGTGQTTRGPGDCIVQPDTMSSDAPYMAGRLPPQIEWLLH